MSTRFALLCFLLCLLFGGPSEVRAQSVSRADSAAVLLKAARDLEADGNWEVAEALLHFISERFGETPAGLEARTSLRAPRPEGATRGSQAELMVWSTTYGLWLGVALPWAMGADDPAPFGVGLLLGGPGGFMGGRALGRSRTLSEGQVRAITFGSLWGSWQGWGLLEVMDWGRQEDCFGDVCYVDGPDGSDVAKAMVVGGLAGVGAGMILARRPISSGVATTVNFGGLWGTWFGVAGAVLADAEGDAVLTSALLGGNAGLLVTALKAPDWNFSRPRARLISISGVIGLLGGLGLDLLVQPSDDRVAMLLPAAGSAVGLAVGLGITEDMASPGAPSEGEDPMLLTPPDPGASLLSYTGGRFRLGTPAPFPTLLPVDGPRGFSYEPGLAVNLFTSRF